jgi:type II secretory pathway component PulK
LAVVINVLVAPQLVVAAKSRDRTLSRYLAQAGVKRAVVALRADATRTYDALNEPWSQDEKAFKDISLSDEGHFSLEYLLPAEEGGESQKRYGLRDEERRININTAPVHILKSFFEVAAEVSARDAAGIAASIADWRDEDAELSENGAEDADYQTLSPGYPCKDGRFEILEELLLVKGVTPAVFDKVKDRLTIFGRGKVNINTADALALRGLGMSGLLAVKVVAYRNGDDGREATEDDNVFQDTGSVAGTLTGLSASETDELNALIAGDLMTTRSDYFRGSSSGRPREGGAAATIDFIVNREEEVVFWREK